MRLGHQHRPDHQGRDGYVVTTVLRHRDGLLDVDHADDVVPVVADDREPRVSGVPSQIHDIGGRGASVGQTRSGPAGLMTSAAVRSPKSSERVSSRAVPSSSVPASAERRTIEDNSCGRPSGAQLLLRLDARERAGPRSPTR